MSRVARREQLAPRWSGAVEVDFRRQCSPERVSRSPNKTDKTARVGDRDIHGNTEPVLLRRQPWQGCIYMQTNCARPANSPSQRWQNCRSDGSLLSPHIRHVDPPCLIRADARSNHTLRFEPGRSRHGGCSSHFCMPDVLVFGIPSRKRPRKGIAWRRKGQEGVGRVGALPYGASECHADGDVSDRDTETERVMIPIG
jgi:hypothetical protein